MSTLNLGTVGLQRKEYVYIVCVNASARVQNRERERERERKVIHACTTGVANAWLSMVLASIPHLPKDTVKRHILTMALAKGQLSQTVNSRQASCQIIGVLASKFEPYW